MKPKPVVPSTPVRTARMCVLISTIVVHNTALNSSEFLIRWAFGVIIPVTYCMLWNLVWDIYR